jgi:hypothetical protein
VSASFSAEGTGNAEAARELKTAIEKLYQRSQGIQAMRDVLFRLCEATQNGTVSVKEYAVLMKSILASLNFVVPFEYCSTASGSAVIPAEAASMCYRSVIEYNSQLMRQELYREGLGPSPVQETSPVSETDTTSEP